MGFKTQKHWVTCTQVPYQLDITLLEENYELKELVINTSENPTNEIIKNAIVARKKNAAKTDKFEAKIKTLVGLSGFNEIADKEYVADWGNSLPLTSACSLVNECGIWDDPKLATKIPT